MKLVLALVFTLGSLSVQADEYDDLHNFFKGIHGYEDGVQLLFNNTSDPENPPSQIAKEVAELLSGCEVSSEYGEDNILRESVKGDGCRTTYTNQVKNIFSSYEMRTRGASGAMVSSEDLLTLVGFTGIEDTHTQYIKFRDVSEEEIAVSVFSEKGTQMITLPAGQKIKITRSLYYEDNDGSDVTGVTISLKFNNKTYTGRYNTRGETEVCKLNNVALECERLFYIYGISAPDSAKSIFKFRNNLLPK